MTSLSRILRQAQAARRKSTSSLNSSSDSSSSSSESSDDSNDMRLKRPLRKYSTHSSMGSLCYATPPRRRSPSLEALQRSTSSPSDGSSSRTPSNSENSCKTPATDAHHESSVCRRDRKAKSNQDARVVSYKRPRRRDCCQVKVPGPSNSDILQVLSKKPKKTTAAASTSVGEQRQQRQSGAAYPWGTAIQ